MNQSTANVNATGRDCVRVKNASDFVNYLLSSVKSPFPYQITEIMLIRYIFFCLIIIIIIIRKGAPYVLAEGGCQKRVSVDLLPNAVEAAGWYDREARSSLTAVSTFGQNPFQSTEDQVAVERQFSMQCPDIASLFECVFNFHQ